MKRTTGIIDFKPSQIKTVPSGERIIEVLNRNSSSDEKTLTNYTENPVCLSRDKSTLSEERQIWKFGGIREDVCGFCLSLLGFFPSNVLSFCFGRKQKVVGLLLFFGFDLVFGFCFVFLFFS